MNQENWQEAKEIFNRALELPPSEREKYLAQVSEEDRGLGEQVKLLLESYESSFLENPLLEDNTQLLEDFANQTSTGMTEIKALSETERTKFLLRRKQKQIINQKRTKTPCVQVKSDLSEYVRSLSFY